MNTVLIFAGGVGTRMKSNTTPKQFLKLHGKDIIIHTLEHFEHHPEIDAIVVVCIASWIPYLKGLLCQYSITKVKWVVEGGTTGQESIYNGLKVLKNQCPEDSIVLIHDGVRPLINEKVISDNISCVKENGSAITVAPSVETVITVNDEGNIDSINDRSKSMLAKAPQTFYLRDIVQAHENAISEKRFEFIDSASIMSHYGFSLKTVEGPYENIKITTPSDYYIFRAISEARENSQIFGI